MTKKIFKSNILVAVVVLIFGIACVMAILYQHFGKQIDTELKKEATYLAYGVEQNGVDYLNQIKKKMTVLRILQRTERFFMIIRQMLLLWKITVTVKKFRKR